MAKGKKTGGRQKGTPNKMTTEMRKVLKVKVEGEIENLPELLEQLEPKERLEILLKLMPYVFPKVQPVSSSEGEPFFPEKEFLED